MSKRHGVALLLVIICMIVVTTIIGAMLRHVTLAGRQMKLRMHQIQAIWLAESGVERAVFAIQQDPDYAHEVWRVTAEELRGHHDGQVAIRVQPETDDDSSLAVEVLAIYPFPSEFGVKVRKRITIAKQNTLSGRRKITSRFPNPSPSLSPVQTLSLTALLSPPLADFDAYSAAVTSPGRLCHLQRCCHLPLQSLTLIALLSPPPLGEVGRGSGRVGKDLCPILIPRPLPEPLRVGGEAAIVRIPAVLNPGLLSDQK